MRYYTVDAFSDKVFSGAPTGVAVLDGEAWPGDNVLLSIAVENNLPETAFARKQGDRFALRWFAPNAEVDLCGHATLAAGYVIANFEAPGAKKVFFDTGVGELVVERKGDLYEMDLPSRVPEATELTQELIEALGGAVPAESYKSRDYFFLLESEEAVRALAPDYAKMKALDYGDGVIVTAPGSKSDFVTRAFFPKLLTDEDPVCGSAHCNLTPFWAQRLGKQEMVSHQLSQRGGVIYCALSGDRVKLGGKVALYGKGEILI